MKVKNMVWAKAVLLFCVLLMIGACESSDPAGKGEAEFEITDAPIDDAEVKGVFVTISDVRVNGESISGFSGKQTIDLKAYTRGNTELLGSGELSARTYNKITLVLDHEMDAQGNEPGCYVQMNDDTKYALHLDGSANGTSEITLTKAWEVRNDARSRIVLDFDLRKALRYDADTEVRYKFATRSEVEAAVRVVAREKSGTIEGTCDDESAGNYDKIIIYAYKKGTFDSSAETQGEVKFRNAVASAEVDFSLTGNSYKLAFMEEGEYELHLAGYYENAGRFEMQSMLDAETSAEGSVSNIIKVNAGATVNISAVVKGEL